MKKVIILLLLTNGITFFLTKNNTKTVVEASYKGVEEAAIEGFVIGCQVGYVKRAKYEDIGSRVDFCADYVQKNPKILEALKRKSSWIIESYGEK